MHFQLSKIKIFMHNSGGIALSPQQGLCPWTPHTFSLDHTREFLHFTLNDAPSKQLLKVDCSACDISIEVENSLYSDVNKGIWVSVREWN